jgi:hypothetical protein
MGKKAKKKAKKKASKKVSKKAAKKTTKKAAKKPAKKKARRTVMHSSKGKKLNAVRSASGQFKDIQQYSRAHAADIRRSSAAEAANAPALSEPAPM